MKKLFWIIFLLLLTPVMAFGASIEGTIQGYNCVLQGKTCPIGGEDPLVATEVTFVLLTADNKYYFVPNVDRAVMARQVAKEVRINGIINNENNSIRVSTIEVKKDGKWRVVYSSEWLRASLTVSNPNEPFQSNPNEPLMTNPSEPLSSNPNEPVSSNPNEPVITKPGIPHGH